MKRKAAKRNGRNARHWWNYNVPNREPWSEEQRDARKANMAMFRAIGVGLILSICGSAGASWITIQAKLTELELDVAVLKAHVTFLRNDPRTPR